MRIRWLFFLLMVLATPARAQDRLPILDVHLHAVPADHHGPPPVAMCTPLDIPVGIHVGTGPPGQIYLGVEGYRARLHSALTMEEVLVRHPRLRVYLAHAGSQCSTTCSR